MLCEIMSLDRHCMCNVPRNLDALSCYHCCRWKAMCITYSECVFVALVIQHTKRMRYNILSSVACLAEPYFPTLSHKWLFGGGGRGGGNLLNIKCVF
jgi:hypothetical protein